MNKDTFLQELEKKLMEVQASDIDKTKEYYDEMISDRMDDGMDEEAAVAAMGDLDSIMKDIMINRPMPVLVKESIRNSKEKARENGKGTLWTVLAICGFPLWGPLLIAFVAVIFALYISVWAVIISLYAVILALGIYFICGLFGSIALLVSGNAIPTVLALLGTSLICGSMCVLFWFPMQQFSKLMIRAMKETILKIKKWFVPDTKKEME